MKCGRCGGEWRGENEACPFCGARGRLESGVFHTSAVYVAAGRNDRLYHSVDEMPTALRSTLERSTNGANSGTIIIADRNGRREIAKAVRHWRAAGSPTDVQSSGTRHGRRRVARIAAAVFLAMIACVLIAAAAAIVFRWL